MIKIIKISGICVILIVVSLFEILIFFPLIAIYIGFDESITTIKLALSDLWRRNNDETK